MGFYKDFCGLFLFIICHLEFILQFYFIYYLSDIKDDDNKQNIFLTIHKTINYILLFLTVYCHIKTSIIDPGSISNKNNKAILEFYYYFHQPFISRALKIIQVKTPERIKEIILGETGKIKKNEESKKNEEENEEEEEEEKEKDDDMSEKDDYPFENKPSINDSEKKTIEEKTSMRLTKCINCFAVRPINTHHCSVCHKCVIEQDHHCPWVNNCIGLFNKKIFILFLFYGSIEVIYSVLLFFYYQLYKNINQFKNEPFLIVLDIFALIFGLILAIVSLMLLWDQYDTIIHSITQCDFKEGLLLEKSTVRQQINLIFGGNFSFRWFLPFYPGGNINKYNELMKKREAKANGKSKNE